MSSQELRAGQLLTTYGPGALVDFADESVIIAGLRFWHYDQQQPIPVVKEPRLAALIQHRMKWPRVEFRLPPQKVESFAESRSYVKGFQFPEWLQVKKAEPVPGQPGAMRRRLVQKRALNGAGRFVDEAGHTWPVVPVRFVQACAHGHISDIDWNYVIHQDEACKRRTFWIIEGSSSSGLASIKVACECGREINMSSLFKEGAKLGPCRGQRPWLGYGATEACAERNKAVVRSASNVYYPQMLTVISIPDAIDPIWAGVCQHWAILQSATDLAMLNAYLVIPQVKADLGMFAPDSILPVIQAKQLGEEPALDTRVKELEFKVLQQATPEAPSDIPNGEFFAREITLRRTSGLDVANYFSKIVAVHKLREVGVLYGFTRLEPIVKDINGEPDPAADLDIQLARIGLDEDWLPAIENHGEGIFLQFNDVKISDWKSQPAVVANIKELETAFKESPIGQKTAIAFPGIEYYLAHSLCHLLMNTLTLECGYPASSLKERVYFGDSGLGFLIYTASSDAEGTLGGLVQKGKDIGRFLGMAIDSARLCSNDPLCASHKPSDPDNRYLSGAACHSCLHVPETACEQWNQFLDRNLVVETLERKGTAFFS